VAAGRNYVDPALAQRIALRRLLGRSHRLRILSAREYEIFCLLANDIPAHDIATRLALSLKTIANYSSSINGKLGIHTRDELKALAAQYGVAGIAGS
jgi:DNA-binding NarL/FixJ family response regulator